jgi:hypothetical protein
LASADEAADALLKIADDLMPATEGEFARDPVVAAHRRAELDAKIALLYGLSARELAGVLGGFPLLDRDQPWLPGEGFIAYNKKGKPRLRPRSFVTRDKVMLEYFRLSGQKPPEDIVAFFAAASVDIDGGRVLAGSQPADRFNPPIFATGLIRNLEERVHIAEEELGAVAYVPTLRKRPTDEGLARSQALAVQYTTPTGDNVAAGSKLPSSEEPVK